MSDEICHSSKRVEKMAQMAREFIERGEQIAAANRQHNGDTVMRISDTGKPITLAEIEAQRQGKPLDQYGLSDAYKIRQARQAEIVGNFCRGGAEPVKSLEPGVQGDSLSDQGIPFDFTFIESGPENQERIDRLIAEGIMSGSEVDSEGIQVAYHRASLLDDIQDEYDAIEECKEKIRDLQRCITHLDNNTL